MEVVVNMEGKHLGIVGRKTSMKGCLVAGNEI